VKKKELHICTGFRVVRETYGVPSSFDSGGRARAQITAVPPDALPDHIEGVINLLARNRFHHRSTLAQALFPEKAITHTPPQLEF